MAKLRENRAKHKLARGEVVTLVMGFNTADVIDFLGPLGFDSILLEGEHGPVDFADIPDLTRACDLWGMTSVARVNLNVPGVLYRTLDVGAQGIMVPHVNTAEEARAAVEAIKFAPIGARGMYTNRQGYGVGDYLARANDETLLTVLIEDIVAIRNLPEILEVDRVDVFYVAPGDLAQSMGYIGQTDHPEVKAIVDKAISQIVGAGRVAGALVNDSTVEHYVKLGARFLGNSWTSWLASGARSYLRKVAAAGR
jgi:4-hydroxy-2-oxoheptanedioate aldolase